MGLREPLGHHLPRAVDVGARLEDEEDPRQAGNRLGANVVEEGDAVEQVLLQRHRDQLLDLRRRQPERLGLDLDRGRHELREDVHGHLPELADTHHQRRRSRSYDQQSKPQNRLDDRTHLPYPQLPHQQKLRVFNFVSRATNGLVALPFSATA